MSESDFTLDLIQKLGEQIASLHPAVQKLYDYAYRDDLTGLPNARVMYEVLDRCVTQPRKAFWVVFGDLNDFKQLNQDYKHNGADAALRTFGAWLGDQAEKSGAQAFRRSGDEFILVVRHGKLNDLLTRLAKAPPKAEYNGQSIAFRASFGAAKLDTKADNPIETAMDRAELACMTLKFASGTVRRWTPGMSKIESARWTCKNCGSKTNLSLAPSCKSGVLSCPVCQAVKKT